MYDIGEFDRRITFIETDIERENELGEIELDDRDLVSVWAKVDEVKGNERYKSNKIDAERDYEIVCRYRPGITQTMKIRYEDRLLEIVEPVREIGRREYTEIVAREYVTDRKRYEKDLSSIDNIKVILGLPGSGKTSYVENKMTDRDLVLDLDKIIASLTNSDIHDRKGNSYKAVSLGNKLMEDTLRNLEDEYKYYGNIYYIRVVLNDFERDFFKKIEAEIYYIDVDMETIEERLLSQNREFLIDKIPKWLEWYEVNRDILEVI